MSTKLKKAATATAAASKTLYLIRHGQSIANRDGNESSSYRDAGLTNLGINQARSLRDELERIQLDLVVVSPLTRALQTCENALPSSYTGPVIVLPDIAEVCSSYYSCGQPKDCIEKKFPQRFNWSNVPMDDIWWWPYEQKMHCEPHEHQSKRIARFRQFIREQPEQRIAVFSHGDYLWEFFEGKRPYLSNCQLMKYTFEMD
jgi:glucosyl-3-phosphoglycerate phosphatase